MSAASPTDRSQALLANLVEHLRGLGSVLVCYSGGIDSAFVLAAATRALGGEKAIGMTAVSPSLPASELDDAERVAREVGATHRLVHTSEMQRQAYRQNGPDRCFHCKTELYLVAEQKRVEWDLAHVLNGTNLDDLGDYRPGLQAAEQAGVRSPLLELGFSKSDVREAARTLGLEIWNKPAAACLASRLPFGTAVTEERLDAVAKLERALGELGFARVRVRYHSLGADNQALARIELDADEISRAAHPELRAAITDAGAQAGFLFVTLDLAGYRMGSQNALLKDRRLPVIS